MYIISIFARQKSQGLWNYSQSSTQSFFKNFIREPQPETEFIQSARNCETAKMSSKIPYVKHNNGTQIQSIGLGTYTVRLRPEDHVSDIFLGNIMVIRGNLSHNKTVCHFS